MYIYMILFGINNAKNLFKDKISYSADYKDVLKEADVCFIFTEWNEIKGIDINEYVKLMKTPLVYDGRNIYKIDEVQTSGVEYYSIGR